MKCSSPLVSFNNEKNNVAWFLPDFIQFLYYLIDNIATVWGVLTESK